MDFKRNVSCFGELPILASPNGCGEALQSTTDMNPFGDVFRIEDLSQFSNEDIAGPIPTANVSSTLSSVSSETVPKNGIWASFAADDFSLCHPFYEGIGGEWLSDFVEDSFMGGFDLASSFGDSRDITNDVLFEKQQTQGVPQLGGVEENPVAHRKRVLPGGARSKRSRAVAFRGWSYQDYGNNVVQQSGKGRKAGAQDRGPQPQPQPQTQTQTQQPRRCTHCLSQRTPQWRAGPLGPKSLCNACGVRFKSGRLFPEYRPAKSPTFVGSVHSNSHKKVLEMRNQLSDVQTPLESQEHQPLKVKIKISGLDDVSSGSN